MNQVEAYIYNQKEELRELLIAIRLTILKSEKNISEKLSFGIPFFYGNKPLCYLNPKESGIDIGLCKGIYFNKTGHLLELKNRKQIKTYFIGFNTEIKIDELKSILSEALEIDKTYTPKKRNRNK